MTQETRLRTCIDAGFEELTASEYNELLATAQRRTILDVLSTSTAPIELMDLAVTVAERESYGDVPDEATVERIAISLHHQHLPKMAELGVIDYDPVAARVESCH